MSTLAAVALALALASPAPPPGMVFLPAADVETGCIAVTGKAPWLFPKQRRRLMKSRAFFLDRSEVTVAAYRACVDAGRCTPPPRPELSNFGLPGRDQHPVSAVTWKQAQAYCRFVGKRLPTELEWDRAAQGPTPSRDRYVWGNEAPDCEHVAGGPASGESVPEKDPRLCTADVETPSTLPVCSRPRGNSKEGLCDLVGNVSEWVADWFVPLSPPPRPLPAACARTDAESDDCPMGRRHVTKGGTGGRAGVEIRQRMTCQGPQTQSVWDNGIRCAQDAPAPR